jgi:hypothetical protein
MPTLHRASEEFDERNLFLQMLLGFLSLAERLDAALERDAPEQTASGNGGEPPHALDLALLGAIATSRRLREQLSPLVTTPIEAPRQAVASPPPPGPEMLRRLLK